MRKKNSALRVLAFILLAILLLALIAASGFVIWYKNSIAAVNPQKCAGDSCKYVDFVVEPESGVSAVAQKLEDAGLIKSAVAYKLFMKLEGKDDSGKSLIIQSGTYSLNNEMSVSDLARIFNAGAKTPTFRITFLPGGTVADAKKRLTDQGYSKKDIDAAFAAKYNHPVLASKPDDANLEGYIYGETYEFYATATVGEILTRTFDELEKVVESENLEAKFKAQGLSLHEGIVLASVVQRESGTIPGDMPHVAQVFLLRLKKGIVLGSDAIIGYAADQINPDRDKTDMSYLTSIQCPWNSRKCPGLPPAPIASPGKGALQAVANPTDTDDLYFLTGDDQKMYYAHTEAEHDENARKYCKVLCGYL